MLTMEIISLYRYSTCEQALEKELERLTLFKLGDPIIIGEVSQRLASKMVHLLDLSPNTIIIAPPSDNVPSPSRILSEIIAKKLGVDTFFPKKLRSAQGYSKLRTSVEKRACLNGQFTFEDQAISREIPVIIDDVVVSGIMASTLNEELALANCKTADSLVVGWDLSGLKVDIEAQTLEIARILSLQIRYRMRSGGWYLTSALEKAIASGLL